MKKYSLYLICISICSSVYATSLEVQVINDSATNVYFSGTWTQNHTAFKEYSFELAGGHEKLFEFSDIALFQDVHIGTAAGTFYVLNTGHSIALIEQKITLTEDFQSVREQLLGVESYTEKTGHIDLYIHILCNGQVAISVAR